MSNSENFDVSKIFQVPVPERVQAAGLDHILS